MADHTHSPDGADSGCFGCKAAYWRTNGAPGVSFQGGRDFFRGTTIRTEQEKIVAQAKARGNDVVPYHSVFGK